MSQCQALIVYHLLFRCFQAPGASRGAAGMVPAVAEGSATGGVGAGSAGVVHVGGSGPAAGGPAPRPSGGGNGTQPHR
jgi:hypothetical protein